MRRHFIEVLAPMAGITDGKFCSRLSSSGFDILTIGGYNADHESIEAGYKIMNRGRLEFHVEEEDLFEHINGEIKIIKDENNFEGLVSVNIRANSPDPIIMLSKIPNLDIIEINAHCRQPELVAAGCGQGLLKDPVNLHDFVSEVVENSNKKISVKIRANVPGVDDVLVAKAIEEAYADFIHVDAMKPGYDTADYGVIEKIKNNIDTYLIGNNSIRDLISARKMLSSGADGISIARAAMNGTVPFDLSLL